MFELRRPQLCLVTDPAIPHLLACVETALAAGVTMLQLRGHQLSTTQLYALALQLRPRCLQHGAAFIVNDRLDVGLAVNADGFQLGKQSLPLPVARQVVGIHYQLGASVHSLEQARVAVGDGADFLLAGTIFASPSHPGEPTCGLGLLRAIKRAFPACFVLAIGGITAATARQAIEAGADGVAVISAILGAQDVAKVVKELYSVINM